MWALSTAMNFSFHLKKELIIITTCFGGDSKEQNELQNSEMQWSCLLFYNEIGIVQGYISYIILNHYIFPRVWSFLFISEPSKISTFAFGLFLWSQKTLRSITHHTQSLPSKMSMMYTTCVEDTALKLWGVPTCSSGSGINSSSQNRLSQKHRSFSAPLFEPLPNCNRKPGETPILTKA